MRIQPLLRILLLFVLGFYPSVHSQGYQGPKETLSSEAEDTLQATTVATDEEYSPDELKNKISTYTKLQYAGIGICLAGAGSAIYGFASATREAEEENMISGGSLFFIGEGMVFFVGGIVLGAIMNNKAKEYKDRLGKISFNIERHRRFTGLKVVCAF